MHRWWCLSLALAAVGCGGQYNLTVPDQVAATGSDAAVVVRLQRQEVSLLQLSVQGAAIRLRIGEGPQRGAYTDKSGYAAALVPMPLTPQRTTILAQHMDLDGREVEAAALAYAWDRRSNVVAVALDDLPASGPARAEAARALADVSKTANILYVTQEDFPRHAAQHRGLAEGGFPDGPVLVWQRQSWRVVTDERTDIPRLVLETRLVSQLDQLRQAFPNLRIGIGTEEFSARGFLQAGLSCVVVGDRKVPASAGKVIRRATWSQVTTQWMQK